jgi:hypothetical protein
LQCGRIEEQLEESI